MKILIVIASILFMYGCTKTENGLVFGIPDYEKRNIKVSQVDLDILIRAKDIVSEEGFWNKENVKACSESKKYNLYCALEKTSIDVMGEYIHRQAALQEVRFFIDDSYRERWEKQRLADFNSHKDKVFNDIYFVLDKAINIVKGKIIHDNGN